VINRDTVQKHCNLGLRDDSGGKDPQVGTALSLSVKK
jgi:hypothetical protein